MCIVYMCVYNVCVCVYMHQSIKYVYTACMCSCQLYFGVVIVKVNTLQFPLATQSIWNQYGISQLPTSSVIP
jgi:hypothetical protein